MKGKHLFILITLVGLGFSIYHFDIINKLNVHPNESIAQDTLSTPIDESLKNSKKPKKNHKRPNKLNPYSQIENYAFNTPKNKTNTIRNLANYLSKGASNDYEKARIAYAWIARNVKYDDYGYNTGNYGDLSAEGVLKSRKAVCEGFSNLYSALCDSMGLNSSKIIGYAKGYRYKIGSNLKETNHAWNTVKIDGEWKLVDVTWGEGYGETVNGKLKSVKVYDPYWFATDPYEFIFKHYPEEKEFQFINSPISKEQFDQLVYADDDIFKLGGSAKNIFFTSLNDINYAIPQAWVRDYDLILTDLELNQNLSSSQEYKFKLKCKEDIDIAFINDKSWTYFKKENGYYVGKIKPQNGILTLNVKLNGFENNYWPILEYDVK